jgi:hypothetical protein
MGRFKNGLAPKKQKSRQATKGLKNTLRGQQIALRQNSAA